MRILIIEDDPMLAQLLEQGISAHGYQPVIAHNGEEGVSLATGGMVDLVLLDVSLPDMDGHQVLQRVRASRSELPVLMLTARRGLRDKVSALGAGADDYLTKPFEFEELIARIRALARRADQSGSSHVEAGELAIDLLSREVRRGDRKIELSSREFALLEYFMRHPRQVLTRQQILSALWDYAFDPGSNVVDVYVRRLRRKIDRPGEESFISTVRGAGYRFDPPAAG